jgi:hypothetical protein
MDSVNHSPLAPWLIVCLLLVPQSVISQECEAPPARPPALDAIDIAIYGGWPARTTLLSLDASGQVILRRDGPHREEALLADAEPGVFETFRDRITHAVEVLRQRGERPNPATLQELLELVQAGRLEPLCRSPEDGIDTDITLHIDGERVHYSCVTGELREIGHEMFEVVSNAINETGRELCPEAADH